MAVITPPIGIQSGSHSAKSFRQLAAALVGADVGTFAGGVGAVNVGHGLVRSSHLAVTQNGTPNMSVNVGAGTALVNGTSSLAQGIYAVTNDAPTNLSVAVADATNPRRDLVVMQVRDNTEDSSGSNDGRLFVITGTPAASPSDPAVPAGCLVLARVAVAASVTTITNANISSLAGLARGSAWNQSWGVVPNGYQQIVSGTAAIGTTVTDIAGLSVTFTAVAGRRYRITGQALSVKSTGAANDTINLYIRDGGAIGLALNQFTCYAAGITATLPIGVSIAPPAGSTTYKLSFNNSAGTSTISASGTNPAWILVEDIGPA